MTGICAGGRREIFRDKIWCNTVIKLKLFIRRNFTAYLLNPMKK